MEMLIAAARHNFGSLSFRIEKRTALYLALVLTLVVMVVEWIAGVKTNSVMLQSDAVHMLSHAASLAVTLTAMVFERKHKKNSHPLAAVRWEFLGAFVNGILLVLFTADIAYMSVLKFIDPTAVEVNKGFLVATIGLVTNLTTALLLGWAGLEDLNSKSAFYHLLADTFSSVAIMFGMILIRYTQWYWIDALLSMVVAVVVGRWCFNLLRDSAAVLVNEAPKGICPNEVSRDLFNKYDLISCQPVVQVSRPDGKQLLATVTVTVYPGTHLEYRYLKQEIANRLQKKHGIHHTLVQFDW